MKYLAACGQTSKNADVKGLRATAGFFEVAQVAPAPLYAVRPNDHGGFPSDPA